MNTTTKNKLLTVLLLSMIVLIGGGIYLQYADSAQKNNLINFLFEDSDFTQSETIIPPVELAEYKKLSSGTQNHHQEQAQVTTPPMNVSNPFNMDNATNSRELSISRQKSSVSDYRSETVGEQVYSNGNSALLAINNNKWSSSRHSTSSYGNTGAGFPAAAFVPFKDNNPNGYALVDPGTEMHMQKITPVGDSLWLLLLLALSYIGIKKIRR